MNSRTIRLLGISGSPRLASTDYVVKDALDYAKQKHAAQTEYITLHKRTIGFCNHCDFCVRKREGCIQKDGMEEIYEKFSLADAVLIGTPVYQGTLSGQVKTMLRRAGTCDQVDSRLLRDQRDDTCRRRLVWCESRRHILVKG
jgi:multimeric flavodoxin WrbA